MLIKDINVLITKYPNFKNLKSFRQVILVTASVFDGIALWSNGLHQNALYLYKLFEIAGYFPIFVSNNKPDSKETLSYRFITIPEYIGNPFPVYCIIEIALKLNHIQRNIFKKNGTKLYKLFLGNILNIDIEIPIMSTQDFCHHLTGSHGTMLLSPHYSLSKDYSSSLYNVFPKSLIAPYVWDPMFIQDLMDTYVWPTTGPYSFTAMEPNISFQKCSLVPIMICDAYYRSNPDKMEGLVVINGLKLTESKYFLVNILSNLELKRAQKLFLIKRLTIRAAATTFKQNIIIHHAVYNDYNYLFLEYLFMGFPVIHNYEMLKEYGYYYKGDDIEAGKDMIDYVISNHGANIENYKASCRQLLWRFSIYNPDNIKEWSNIFEAPQ